MHLLILLSQSGRHQCRLSIVGKPVIFYSPNVAEDHQTKNAKAIVDKRTFIERI
jgi:UDP-N-acetylglucosamine--N-acetylmuramyl-(pentapeptide) pyrophosphoryl-undecaprenol N-acetylglucosamine transferase